MIEEIRNYAPLFVVDEVLFKVDMREIQTPDLIKEEISELSRSETLEGNQIDSNTQTLYLLEQLWDKPKWNLVKDIVESNKDKYDVSKLSPVKRAFYEDL